MLNIIIPAYKAKDTLPKALDSLVSQTKTMFLVTIVQDCDDEDYSDIISEYTKRGLHITFLKTPENGGAGMARQLGIDHITRADYCMFLDADDMLMPRAVEILYTEAKKHDADVVISDFYVERGHALGEYRSCENTPITWCHGKIYKVSYLRDNNIRFLPNIRYNEDSYFNLVAVNSTNKKFRIKELTYLWRNNKNSVTRTGEDTEECFKKSWLQYIDGQIAGIEKIGEITGGVLPELIAYSMIHIYEHCMKANYLKNDIHLPQLFDFGQTTLMQNALNSEKFWETICSELKASTMFDKSLIFYKIRFCDWINQYVTGEQK